MARTDEIARHSNDLSAPKILTLMVDLNLQEMEYKKIKGGNIL
jgi:hypothetical protein